MCSNAIHGLFSQSMHHAYQIPSKRVRHVSARRIVTSSFPDDVIGSFKASTRHLTVSVKNDQEPSSLPSFVKFSKSLTSSLPLLAAIAGFNLEGPGSVVEAISVLAFIVFIHECGHFTAARLQNIHVSKFSLGFGPVLTKVTQGEVEYTLRAFPLGGFVAFPDDDPNSPIPADDPDLLKNRPIVDRAIVISAGVVANIVFAFLVLFTQVSTVGLMIQQFQDGVVVPGVTSGSVADLAGIREGDVILRANSFELGSKQTAVDDLVNIIRGSEGHVVQLVVLRNEDLLTLELTPDVVADGSGRIGVKLAPNGTFERVKADGVTGTISLASKEFVRLLTTVTDGLLQLVFNFSQTAGKISGPVAIVAVGAQVARADVSGLFQFAALVNLNLAVVNLLPLPALDGGFLALLIVEAVRGGKKLPNALEKGIMSSGIILLLGSGIILMVRDALSLGGLL